MKLNRALFLDLDKTVIYNKSGAEFPKSIDDWKFIPRILERIKFYSDEGFYICIVSNQGGIQLGYVSHEFIQARLNSIQQEIEQYIHAAISYAYCPHMDHYDRKPNPGMAYQMALNLNLDLRECIMIGDADSDEEFAKIAGIGTYSHVNDFTLNYR